MVPTMAAMVIFPAQARLFESDRAAFSRFLEASIRCCFIAGFAVSLAVVALAPLLFHLIYAPRLSPAAPILQILILGTTVMVIDQTRPLLWLAFRPILAAGVALMILFIPLTRSVIADLALAILSYGFILWGTRALQAKDWRALQQLIVHRRDFSV